MRDFRKTVAWTATVADAKAQADFVKDNTTPKGLAEIMSKVACGDPLTEMETSIIAACVIVTMVALSPPDPNEQRARLQ